MGRDDLTSVEVNTRLSDDPSTSNQTPMVIALRRLILLLFLLGVIGAASDLVLLGHYESAWQLTPLVLIAVTIAVLVWWAVGSGRNALRIFQMTMVCLIASGLTGLWLHYRANTEFEREVSPSLTGFDLFWKAIRGASPPSLAPATLIHLGLLGLAFTYQHPVLHSRTTTSASKGDRS